MIVASQFGHAEAIKALLTAPDIDVNRANVSLYLLFPPDLGVLNKPIYLSHPNLRNVANTFFLSPTHMYPRPSPPISASNSICIYNPPFIRPLFLFPSKGKLGTALHYATHAGHIEAIKALLTAPDINANYTDVSLYLLIPPYVLLSLGLHDYLLVFLTATLAMMIYIILQRVKCVQHYEKI